MGNSLKIQNRNISKKKLKDINPKLVKSFPWKDEYIDCYVYKVYDGDTIKILFKYKGLIFKYSIRISGIDTPEVSRCSELEKIAGIKVRNYLKTLIENEMVKVYCTKFDKYGSRLIGNVYYNGVNISDELITKNYAKLYDGEKKEEWTEEELEKILYQ